LADGGCGVLVLENVMEIVVSAGVGRKGVGENRGVVLGVLGVLGECCGYDV